jgi:hypothetical protein
MVTRKEPLLIDAHSTVDFRVVVGILSAIEIEIFLKIVSNHTSIIGLVDVGL